MRQRRPRLGIAPALLLALLALPRFAAAAGDSVVLRWNEATLEAIRNTRPGPTVAARALAVVHTCIYDAWAAYDAKAVGTRLGGSLRRPAAERTLANKNKAISYAAYRALTDLFPLREEGYRFTGLMGRLGYDPGDASTDTTTPAGIGNVAARAVLRFRHQDGANQLGNYWGSTGAPYSDYTGYRSPNDPEHLNDPGCWQPLRVSNGWGGFVRQRFYCAHWQNVVPFALTESGQFRPAPGPAPFGSERYRAQAEQMLRLSAQLADREKAIAEYWEDGPSTEFPPGHWCLFAQAVSRRHGYGVDEDTKLFFALGNALLDAGIACWDAKRAFDYVRPISAIHALFRGKKVAAWAGPFRGAGTIPGEDWQPYQPSTVVTPPFPEFPSGHSTFSAASAEILKSFTGSDAFGHSYTLPAGRSRVEPGRVPAQDVTLSWATFSEAAEQAGLSRRLGGIHFEEGDLAGRAMGRQVGALVWSKALTYFDGSAPSP